MATSHRSTTPPPAPVALSARPLTALELSDAAPASLEADVLVLAAAPVADASDDRQVRLLVDGVDTAGLDVAALEELLPTLGFDAALDSVRRLPATLATASGGHAGARTVLVVGVGQNLAHATDTARDASALGEDRLGVLARAAGRAVRALRGTQHVVLALPAATGDDLRGVLQGAAGGAYAWTGKAPAPAAAPGTVTVTTPLAEQAAGRAELSRAQALAGSLRLVRDLVNEPPNRLTPAVFADAAARLAAEVTTSRGHLATEVLDDAALRAGGFGGIVGVGQGSVHPPRLVRVSWVPTGGGDGAAAAPRRVGLIGKGITFDSGGLSLKPPASMPEMKSDMAGAATVLGTVLAAANLGLGVRVDAWLALAENMPTADAQRPSDIVTMYGGTTVEITNTDAEGRLVMADALARAVEDDLDAVLDVATLTGAQIVALGDRVSGVMGTPDLRDQVVTAARRAGEAFWAMPLPEHLRGVLDSPYAALRNSAVGKRAGGMLVAGLFLREFVGDTPWAHLDVAGPAFNDGAAWGGTPQGGTGAGVATLVELLSELAA